MNVLAGVVIGFLSVGWATVAEYTLYWAGIHVAYGMVLRMHRNPVVASSEGGNPILSYYLARFVTGLLTAGISAAITFAAISFFRG